MKLKFNVTGMTCAACSARVEKVTNAVAGVEKAEVNLLAGTMQVEAAEDVSAAIIAAVAKAGYGASVPGEQKAVKKEEKNKQLDAIYQQMEEILKEKLSTKVVITGKENGAGKIEIEFFSHEELDRLIDMMNKIAK